MPMSSLLGYALIIGAMKSGTTTLHSLLEKHSSIVRGVRKELNFFRDEVRPRSDTYEKLFPSLDKSVHAYTLDSSPHYAKALDRMGNPHPNIPARIAYFGSTVDVPLRLIYILRDPVERADSHIAHHIARGHWTTRSINYNVLLDASSYAAHLDAYASVGLANVLLLNFERLIAEPADVVHRVTDFLDLPAIDNIEPCALNSRAQPGRVIRSDMAARLRNDLARDLDRLIEVYGFSDATDWTSYNSASRSI